ncbi:MAG TPA: bifunctional phosphopantothenoylcysteine decarboxylase/phosphopantothenate--cysteine ligase CoaBC [Steroidobacteraceae bacterium]|nr:bifunctional phosphopantothenoylcysteine decarboxylase/phosphopantothenate--cysteine ligase CoaBC [Steroidobacteraceae bacterium]
MRGKHVLLGVTGGIAAYKSAELVRRLVERGAEVQVVMTAAAREFIGATTFQALSGRPVRDSLWDAGAEAAMGHIELARWADLVLVAPASADFLARLAHGRADDLLATLCLATRAPIVVAPAMNQQMWANAATQANVATLARRKIRLVGPAVGDQACGETGPGRMLEPTDIADLVEPLLTGPGPFTGVRVLVTAGPTRECLDPVRFVSNRSSGKMGYSIAQAFRAAGAEVVLVSGPVALPAPAGVQRVCVESAAQMYDAVRKELPTIQVLVATAAVADYRPVEVAERKIKKRAETLSIEMTRTTDILASVAADPKRPFVVGFAAETDAVEQHALEKLLRKNLDMICANEVGATKAFDCEDNALLVLWRGGGRAELPRASKRALASALVELVGQQYRAGLRAGTQPDRRLDLG